MFTCLLCSVAGVETVNGSISNFLGNFRVFVLDARTPLCLASSLEKDMLVVPPSLNPTIPCGFGHEHRGCVDQAWEMQCGEWRDRDDSD